MAVMFTGPQQMLLWCFQTLLLEKGYLITSSDSLAIKFPAVNSTTEMVNQSVLLRCVYFR